MVEKEHSCVGASPDVTVNGDHYEEEPGHTVDEVRDNNGDHNVNEVEGNNDRDKDTNDVAVSAPRRNLNDFRVPEEYLVEVEELSDNEDEDLQHGRSVLRALLENSRRYGENVDAEELENGENVIHEDGETDFIREGILDVDEPNYSEDEGSYTATSNGEHVVRRPSKSIFFQAGNKVPVISVGMKFLTKKDFKNAVNALALHQRRDITYVKDEGWRCRAKCKDENCDWRILCSSKPNEDWKVATCQPTHSHLCQEVLRSSRLTYKVIAEYFIKKRGLEALSMTQQQIKDAVYTKWNVEATLSQCRYAKMDIKRRLQGNVEIEFERLEDYAEELRRSNVGSTVSLLTEEEDGKNVFRGLYICFAAIKKGFKNGCRRIIGVDGAFLKGPFKGELLAAVGRDANNQMFPLAWAVVEKEDMKTWKWFLLELMQDLNIAGGTGGGWTFCSDQQKGLVRAIYDLMPYAEHRRCARHIFAKWRKSYSGKAFQKQFWATVKASTRQDYQIQLSKLESIGTAAKEAFEHANPHLWCLAFFSNTHCKSDVVDNNMCESFNSFILPARFKSIISLLEKIRLMVIKKTNDRRKFMSTFKGDYGDRIWPKIEDNRALSRKFRVFHSYSSRFEVARVSDVTDKFIVNLSKQSCSCRMWDFTGIPCGHAMCAIRFNKEHVEQYISPYYTKAMYEKSYKHTIKPVNGPKFWPQTGKGPVIAPKPPAVRGRPKKKRVMEEWEVTTDGIGLARKGRQMTCKICFQRGHNRAGCPKNPKKAAQHATKSPNRAVAQDGPIETAVVPTAPPMLPNGDPYVPDASPVVPDVPHACPVVPDVPHAAHQTLDFGDDDDVDSYVLRLSQLPLIVEDQPEVSCHSSDADQVIAPPPEVLVPPKRRGRPAKQPPQPGPPQVQAPASPPAVPAPPPEPKRRGRPPKIPRTEALVVPAPPPAVPQVEPHVPPKKRKSKFDGEGLHFCSNGVYNPGKVSKRILKVPLRYQDGVGTSRGGKKKKT